MAASRLPRAPADITLEDIYNAVEPGGALFVLRERGNPRCPVQSCHEWTFLPPLFGAADAAVDQVLTANQAFALVEKIP